MEIALGLDVSTKAIGLSLASVDEDNIKVLLMTHLQLHTPKNMEETEKFFAKSKLFEEKLRDFSQYPITRVIIEEPSMKNNVQVSNMLLRFNGMIAQVVYNVLNIVPCFIASHDARTFAFPDLLSVRKYQKHGSIISTHHIKKTLNNNDLTLFGNYPWDCSKKHVLLNKVSEMYPSLPWIYNQKGELSNKNFDVIDSLICILGYYPYMKYKDTEPTVSEWSEYQSSDGKYTIFDYNIQFCDKTFTKRIEIVVD